MKHLFNDIHENSIDRYGQVLSSVYHRLDCHQSLHGGVNEIHD